MVYTEGFCLSLKISGNSKISGGDIKLFQLSLMLTYTNFIMFKSYTLGYAVLLASYEKQSRSKHPWGRTLASLKEVLFFILLLVYAWRYKITVSLFKAVPFCPNCEQAGYELLYGVKAAMAAQARQSLLSLGITQPGHTKNRKRSKNKLKIVIPNTWSSLPELGSSVNGTFWESIYSIYSILLN